MLAESADFLSCWTVAVCTAMQREHPEEAVPCKKVGQAAGEQWRRLTPEEKAPYEAMSAASKAEYARLASMNPMERVMTAASAALQVLRPP